MDMKNNHVSAKARYTHLSTDREPFLSRARACAEITIPYLLPPEGAQSSTYFLTPYQSVGSLGVNNLAAKILLTMLPDNETFFRLGATAADLEAAGLTISEGEVILQAMEQAVQEEIESRAMRVQIMEAIKHLLVTGNALVYMTPKDGLKFFRMDRYVVRRDAMGNPVEIIIHETIHPSLLPEAVQELLSMKHGEKPQDDGRNDKVDKEDFKDTHHADKDVDMYTFVRRNQNGRWLVHQEVEDCVIPKSESSYPKGKCPYLALRLNALDSENYGRGFVEEYYGDLRSIEDLNKALVEASQAAARVLFLVRPNGVTRERTLQQLPNGGIGSGHADDVSCIQLDKQADFSVARQQIDEITRRMESAFLQGTSIQRRGERVTAEEIRYLATELEQGLGGIYSLLAVTLQKPLVELIITQLQRERRLPPIPKELVKTHIVTGLSALGRNNDFERLVAFRNEVAQAAPMLQQGASTLNANEYILRICTSLGIDPDNLVKTAEQTSKENSDAANQAMASQIMTDAAPDALNTLIKTGLAPDSELPA